MSIAESDSSNASSGPRALKGRRRSVNVENGSALVNVTTFDDQQDSVPAVIRPATSGVDLASWAAGNRDMFETLLVAHMRWLHAKGLQPDRIIDRPQDIDEPVVVEDMTAIGYLIGVADEQSIAVDDADLANLTEAHLAYLEEIGAIGPEAADPDVSPLMLGRGDGHDDVPPLMLGPGGSVE